MVYDWKMELYWRLPVFLQEMMLSAYSVRLNQLYYGGDFRKWCKRLQDWQGWSREEALGFQTQHLVRILEIAGNRVPYYKGRWRNIKWKSVHTPALLNRLPLLSKQEIRQNEKAFIVEGRSIQSLWMEKTSGTTGTSLRIYWPKEMLPMKWAIMEIYVRRKAGVAQEIPRAMMGGRPIVRGDTIHPPYWRYNRYWRQLYLSSYHVSLRTAPYYVEALLKYGSKWMIGYGSAIAALAESATEAGLSKLSLKSIIASGDTLSDGMRKAIEQFFCCRCYNNYLQCEGIAMAMECTYGRMHVDPVLGIVEIVNEEGVACPPGEIGEIVATGLLNDAMPLIRYRLGDHACWAENQDCPCGNQQPIITHLEGRVDDYLITTDGRKIGRLSTAMKRSPTIHSAQLVQDRPGHAYLLIRPSEGYSSKDALAVCDDIVERIGRFDLEVLEVPEIPRTPQGKTSLVVRLADRPAMQETYSSVLRVAINKNAP
jgi:phenylacetate-CoA ligase